MARSGVVLMIACGWAVVCPQGSTFAQDKPPVAAKESVLRPSADPDASSVPADTRDPEYVRHMKNGLRLFHIADMPGAIAEFEAAYEVSPRAQALVNLSRCYGRLPKAVAVLDRALEEHSDTMSAADIAEARGTVEELRALLAYVTITVEPKTATVTLDGEPVSPGTRVPVSPGVHQIVASLDEYAPATAQVKVLSKDEKTVHLTLTDLFGTLRVVTISPDTKIEVDGKVVGIGEWKGRVRNGPHIVRAIGETDSGSLQIEPGKTFVADLQKVPDVLPPIPPKDYRGFYGWLSAAALFPTRHPVFFAQPSVTIEGASSGGFVGLRGGYRVHDFAGFEAMLEYGNIVGPANGAGRRSYSLTFVHPGLLARFMSPGNVVRFVGTLGGGPAVHFIDYEGLDTIVAPGCGVSGSGCASQGVDFYFVTEAGAELELEGVLIGLSAVAYLTGTKGMNDFKQNSTPAGSQFEEPYANELLPLFGPRLYLGYAGW